MVRGRSKGRKVVRVPVLVPICHTYFLVPRDAHADMHRDLIWLRRTQAESKADSQFLFWTSLRIQADSSEIYFAALVDSASILVLGCYPGRGGQGRVNTCLLVSILEAAMKHNPPLPSALTSQGA